MTPDYRLTCTISEPQSASSVRRSHTVEIDTLRALIRIALDTDADRDVVLATSKMLRARYERLEELDTPAWIE